MTLSELQNNQIVTYRLGKHGETKINWQPWKQGPIYVQKDKKIIVTPIQEVWAEYSQRDYHGNGFFDAEEYCMEIQDLK